MVEHLYVVSATNLGLSLIAIRFQSLDSIR